MGRKINDGDKTGFKMDKFRGSDFEKPNQEPENFSGASIKTANTIGGAYQENRGRRSSYEGRQKWDNSSFEDGGMDNWNRRQGSDQYFMQGHERTSKKHGGGLLVHDMGHRGRGPKGYKRSDDSIYEDVCVILSLSPEIDASNIEVGVKEGVVFLSGTVHDRGVKKLAEYEIENISGVLDVQNLLTFEKKEELH